MGQTRQGRGCRGRASTAGFKSCTYKSQETLSQTEFFKKNNLILPCVEFSSVQSLSCVRLFVTSRTAARQASLSITNSQSLFKLMAIESAMPSNHLILCHPLLLLPSIFPSIRIFSNESAIHTGGQSIGVTASTSVPLMNT